jgi:hypothetical protein
VSREPETRCKLLSCCKIAFSLNRLLTQQAFEIRIGGLSIFRVPGESRAIRK